jgi:hypothetical protein
MSQPKIVQPAAPAVAAPVVVKAPDPLPVPPVPPAPNPYYDQQVASDAQKSQTQASTLSKARAGRAGLKIDLVNDAGGFSGSGVNTASN